MDYLNDNNDYPNEYFIIQPENKPLCIQQIIKLLSEISIMFINEYYFIKDVIIDTNLDNCKSEYEKFKNERKINDIEIRRFKEIIKLI